MSSGNKLHDLKEFPLYVRSMGKLFRVTALCSTADEANALMERRPPDSVIVANREGLIFLADKYDTGETLVSEENGRIRDLCDILEAAIERVRIAGREGDPILSAWLPDAETALAKARRKR